MKVELTQTLVEVTIKLNEDEAYRLKAILGGMVSPGSYKVDALEELYEHLDELIPLTKYEMVNGKSRNAPSLKRVEDDEDDE